MFEDYSLRAREAVFLARLKAGERGAAEVQTEDLLVGLIIEDQGGQARGPSGLNKPGGGAAKVNYPPHRPYLPPELASDLLARLQAACAHSLPVPNQFDLPVADSVQRIFILATSIRHELRLNYVEPLHLLAASLGDESSRGAQIFRGAGITHEAIFNFIRTQSSLESAISGEEPARSAGVQVGSPVYSQRARQVLFLARREAGARGAEAIDLEDVLVALVTEEQGKFLEALSRYPGAGVSLADLDICPHRRLLPDRLANNLLEGLELLRPRSRPLAPATDLPFAGGVKRALAVADRVRDELREKQIEPLHLLAAILEDTSVRGTQVFLQNGITAEKVIQFIREAT
jgi:hypothetical protein